MTTKTFTKMLSANDVGTTGGHMGGILVPRGDGQLLEFLPALDPAEKNPSAWIDCVAEGGQVLRLRFVYYNNRLHDPNGTRNEYRITYLTKYLRDANAREGDLFEISRDEGREHYRIRIVAKTAEKVQEEEDLPVRIKLNSGWRRVH